MITVKKALLSAAFVGGASLALMQPAFCYSLDFTMVNRTNQPITAMWTALSENPGDWDETSNVFVPDNDGSQEINFQRDVTGDECYYNLNLQFSSGVHTTIRNVNLCSTSTLTIGVDGDGNVTYDPEG